MQLPFPGTLYITAQHTCFSSCTRDGQEIVVKLQHRNVTAANKVQPQKRGQLILCLEHDMQNWCCHSVVNLNVGFEPLCCRGLSFAA